jgi:hypothetical protein
MEAQDGHRRRRRTMIADRREPQRRDPNAAVLSAVGHPLHQRDGGHRHPGASVADDAGHRQRTPLEAGAVVSLISLFNASSRFMWASGSDYIDAAAPAISSSRSSSLFLLIPRLAAWELVAVPGQPVVVFTIRRRVRDDSSVSRRHFRPQNVGAIHGALLTA